MELSRENIERARQKGKLLTQKEEGLEYSRFREWSGKIPRGTVIIGGRVIFGFPHIKRIFVLEKGIERNLTEETFFVEEKIDGYNLRIAEINQKIYAFSRGGFIDWFATEKAREMKFEKFFVDYPSHVLYGEMIGNTPYTRPLKRYGIWLYIFDICNENGVCIPCDEKYDLAKKYDLQTVPLLGKFTKRDMKKIEKIVLKIMKEGKEGIVIKSQNRKNAVKIVNPHADIDDIANNSRLLFDMPTGFFTQRVLRSAIFIKKFKLRKERYVKKLGNAFYEKLLKTLDDTEEEKPVSEEFEISIKSPDIWEKILKHMGKEIKIEKISEQKKNSEIRIKFIKIYKRTNHRFRELLNGKGIED